MVCATVRPFIPDPLHDFRFAVRNDSELSLPAKSAPFANWDDLCKYLMGLGKEMGRELAKSVLSIDERHCLTQGPRAVLYVSFRIAAFLLAECTVLRPTAIWLDMVTESLSRS